ncbi:acyl-CoA ligase (AMP-forming), exosortase A system-associated [Iodidimonas gelatinilytica]|uniref:Acyl-CoA ligase (AMP-forming), exosortase A system-associated n=2 Tax=Iodidimonas gelatinilytica TaxID=1236966 RepID=A0A5A7MZ01_9PROT|nr:acyl-CoA ligase (AMP-forming), exosortase A system-associated [Iodidimonas gelatinilytica]
MNLVEYQGHVGMRCYLQDLILSKADGAPERLALKAGKVSRTYGALAAELEQVAAGLCAVGLKRFDRVAVYLDKRIETVSAFFGSAMAGGIFVPCNPVLKPQQVGHILRDCTARILISSRTRIEAMAETLSASDVQVVVSVDAVPGMPLQGVCVLHWTELLAQGKALPAGPQCDSDVGAIFYTSGSTGKPKGVVLSHRNMVVGGESVATYLKNHADDRILSLLPLSFDAGFSQLTTGFHAGAAVVLHNYLLARDVPRICAREGITGLTSVPPLWMQLLTVDWPEEAGCEMRYFANTGGRMPRDVLQKLRAIFTNADPYLMYGLTEAFRSTYLDPAQVDIRPDSIGKAIPNAEILVVKSDGNLAQAGEEGELVHRGPLVALGYWNDAERTAERYKPVPKAVAEVQVPELAVWSGDLVRIDAEGYLYFVGRTDDMIKTSGYRVSPTEVEEALFDSGLVLESAAFGLPHDTLGHEIIVAVVPKNKDMFDAADLVAHCRNVLPGFMVPHRVDVHESLPRSPNGKIDRKALQAQCMSKDIKKAV